VYKTADAIGGVFAVVDPATGALSAADALPAGTLYLNGVANAATVTVAETVTVGLYTWSVTLPTVADGQNLEVWIAAAVGGVSGGNKVWQGDGCSKRPADIDEALTAIKGAGWTTETLKAIKDAIPGAAPSVAAVADAVWDEATTGHVAAGTFGKLLADLLTAVSALPSSVAAIAAAVWAYATRTLTQSSAQVAAALEGSSLTVHRGDTFDATLTGLGSLTGRKKLVFTVKGSPVNDTDAQSKIQIDEDGGLVRLNGAAYATTTHGSLTVDGTSVAINLHGIATAQLAVFKNAGYDLQVIDSSDNPVTIAVGSLSVTADVTRATS
jgi:hypothetical protein